MREDRGQATMIYTIIVRPEPSGQYTARVYGIAEVCVQAETEAAAVAKARASLAEWLATARLVSVSLPNPSLAAPDSKAAVFSEDDPEFLEYRDEIRRFKQEVDERECSNSSSTPT